MIKKQTQKDGVRKAKELHHRLKETRQRCHELLTTLLTDKLRAQDWRFLSRNHLKPPPFTLRAWIDGFTVKIELSVYHNLCEQVECFRVFLVRSLCILPCSTIDSLGLRTSRHKLIPMICTAYSNPDTISSLLSMMRSPTAAIKPWLVSRSTTQNSGRSKPTNDLTNSSVECIYWISWPQNCIPHKSQDCTANIVPGGRKLQKDSTSDIVLLYRLLN